MANIKLLDRANFSKEIIERTYNASSIITEFTTVFKVLRTANKLTLDKKAQQEFLRLTGKYDLDLKFTKDEALRLVDLINTIIKNKDNIDTDTTFKAGDIISDYKDLFAKQENLTKQQQKIRKKELAELLRVIGKEKEAKQLLSKNDDQIFDFLNKVAKDTSDKTTVQYESLNKIQQIIQEKDQKLLNRLKRSPTILKDNYKTGNLTGKLKSASKKVGGGVLELALNLGGTTRSEMSDMFKDLRGGKDSHRQQLRDLRQEELDRRTQEETRDYLKKLSENEDKEVLKRLSDDDDELEYRKDSLESLKATRKSTEDGFWQLTDKSQDMVSGIDRVADKIEDSTQEIRKLGNQFKFLADDLKRINDTKGKDKEDETSLLEDLTDMFDGGKGKKGKHKGKKGKVKAKSAKLGKLSKLGGVAKSGLKGLGNVAKVAGPVGLAISAGMALSDAYDGYDKDKANALGFDGDTVKGKADSSIASALSGASFGLVGEDTIASGIKFKDEIDNAIIDAVGGKDSILGKIADTVVNPFDNVMNAFDNIGNWFSNKDKEDKEKDKEKAKSEKLTDAQKAVKENTEKVVNNPTVQKLNNLDSAYNSLTPEDQLDPLANGFQNMFDYMAQIPGIGEFFKDKTSGNVDKSTADKVMNMFNPMNSFGLMGGMFSGITSAISGIFSGSNTTPRANYSSNTNTGNSPSANSGYALPMPQVKGSVEGTGAAKQAKDAYIELAKKNGRSRQDIQFALANMARETGGFTKSAGENMNYRSAERIMEVHGAKIRRWGGDVNSLVSNPEALANVVYSDHNGSKLGNTEKGDGWRYRGRGLVQLTGRSNYRKFGKKLGIDLEGNPDLASDPQVAAQIADAYLQERSYGKNFNEFSAGIIGNVTTNTHGIAALEKGRSYLNSVSGMVDGVASPINPENNEKQAFSATPAGQMQGALENIKGTKVNDSQKQAIESGRLKLQTGFKAEGMTGYDPNQRYFQAPKGQISKNDVTKLDPQLYQNLNMMAHEYQATTGNRFVVTNSFRTKEEQAALKAAGYKANRPGYSLHEYGLAVDIQPSQAQELEKMGLLKKYGFYRPLPNDPKEKQHIQPLSIAKTDLAGAGDTQVPESTTENETNTSNPTPPPVPKPEENNTDIQTAQATTTNLAEKSNPSVDNVNPVTPNLEALGVTPLKPSNSMPSLGGLDSGISGIMGNISDIISNPVESLKGVVGNALNNVVSSIPQVSDIIPDLKSYINGGFNISNQMGEILNTGLDKLGIGNLGGLSDVFSNTIGNISNIVTNPIEDMKTSLGSTATGTISSIPQAVTPTPTAKEQTKIQVAQQKALQQQSQSYVQNNISNGGTAVGQGQPVNREEYFDDIIHDVGLSMFNRMQLG